MSSSSSSSSSSASSSIFYGDTLRCILAYFRTHAELNVLRRVSRTLASESSKIPLWPSHLRVIRPREKNFLAQFTSSKNIQPSLQYVHQLDLRYVASPQLKHLLFFTHLSILRLSVRSIQSRQAYSQTLDDFLRKCGQTIKHLHVELDTGYDLSVLCKHMPALEQLDLSPSFPHLSLRSQYTNFAMRTLVADQNDMSLDWYSDSAISASIVGLTPAVNPALRTIRLFWFTEKNSNKCEEFPDLKEKHMKKTREVLKRMEMDGKGDENEDTTTMSTHATGAVATPASTNHRPVSLQTVIRLLHRDGVIRSIWDETTEEMERACKQYPEIQVQQVGISFSLREGQNHQTTTEQIKRFCTAYDALCAVHPTSSRPSLHLQFVLTPSSIERYLGPVQIIPPSRSHPPPFPAIPMTDSPTSNFISFYGLTHEILQLLLERCHVINIECFASRPAPPSIGQGSGQPLLDPRVTFSFGDVLQSAPFPSSSSSSSSSSSIFSSCRHLRSIHLWTRHLTYSNVDPDGVLRSYQHGINRFAELLQENIRERNMQHLANVTVDAISEFEMQQDERWKGLA